MSELLTRAMPAAERHQLWLPLQTISLTLQMPSGEQYAFQTWLDPVRRIVADSVACTNAPAPRWIQQQVAVERYVPV